MGGVKEKYANPEFSPSWQMLAKEILQTSDFERIPELIAEVKKHPVALDPIDSKGLVTETERVAREIEPLVTGQLKICHDPHKEYLTKGHERVLSDLVYANSKKDRAELLAEMLSIPRGMGDGQRVWNNAPAPYQIRAMDMLKAKSLSKDDISEYVHEAKKIRFGLEPNVPQAQQLSKSRLEITRPVIELALKGKEISVGFSL